MPMAGKQAVTREAILDVAYAQAQDMGMASLNIRSVARECGVAIGTIYNHFPDKAALVTEVVGRFWAMALQRAQVCAVSSGASSSGSLVAYCHCLTRNLCDSLRDYRAGWLREISTLDVRTRTRSQEAESAMLASICEGIERAIEDDAGITPAARERLEAPELATFIWRGLFEAIKAGDPECRTLTAMLELALYR